MITPMQIEPVNPGRGVEAEGEGKELKKIPNGTPARRFRRRPSASVTRKVTMKTAIVATDRWASAKASIR